MGTNEEQLNKLFNDLAKEHEKDKKQGVLAYRASDIRIGSHIPYGILTRIPQLDLCMGRPGYPVGRVVELYGLPRTGKTTAALMAIAQAQRIGGGAMFIDTEFTFDEDRARELGVNTDTLMITNSDTIEGAFRDSHRVMKAMKEYSGPFVIVIDSIGQAATEWESKENTDFRTDRPGDQAKAIKRGMRLITPMVARKNILFILVNHCYETLRPWGKASTSTGGHGIKFNASLRVNFAHMKEQKEEIAGSKKKRRLGQNIRIDVEKLKVGHLEHTDFEVDLLNDGGFDTYGSLLEAMVSIGVIKHPSPTSNYTWEDITFPKREWRNVVDSNGGIHVMYKHFIRTACETGYMKEYSSKDLADD